MPLSVEKVIYLVCELIPQTRPITLLFVFAIFCILILSPIKSKISLGGRFNAKVLRTFYVFETLVRFPTGLGPLSFGGRRGIYFLGKEERGSP